MIEIIVTCTVYNTLIKLVNRIMFDQHIEPQNSPTSCCFRRGRRKSKKMQYIEWSKRDETLTFARIRLTFIQSKTLPKLVDRKSFRIRCMNVAMFPSAQVRYTKHVKIQHFVFFDIGKF